MQEDQNIFTTQEMELEREHERELTKYEEAFKMLKQVTGVTDVQVLFLPTMRNYRAVFDELKCAVMWTDAIALGEDESLICCTY